MLKYASESSVSEFIVGTEDGIFHGLVRENPEKAFYPVGTVCHGMKSITLARWTVDPCYKIDFCATPHTFEIDQWGPQENS